MSLFTDRTVVQEAGALWAPAHVKEGCGDARAKRLDELYRAMKRVEQELADLEQRRAALQQERAALPVATATANAADYVAVMTLNHAQAEVLAAMDKALLQKQTEAAEALRLYHDLSEETIRARQSIANLRNEIERHNRPKLDRIAELEQLLAT